MVNPRPRVSVRELLPGQPVVVLDDALRDPRSLVDWAVARRGAFARQGHNAFPGPELRLPEPVTAALVEVFNRHARTALGMRRTLRAHSRLSLVALPPHRLQPAQWLCHRDRLQQAPGERVAASVLYLFDDPALGGTSFFQPRWPAARIDALVADSIRLAPADFAHRHGLSPGYPVEDLPAFRRVATVEARFNRLIFYDGDVFHSGDIRQPQRLSEDPARGRLTLNGFFTGTPAAR
ncbi:MAG: DUF6445 family protein [Lysobacteraceae bacterium]